MNPFGTSPKCPRCDKAVYAAEQIIGPGSQIYHKFCLKCTACNKRLDSYSLVEHDSQPYCKPCHIREFGTQDLRHQNLARASPSASPSSRRAMSPSPPPSITSPLRRVPTAPSNDTPLTPPRTVSPVTESQESETRVSPPALPARFPPTLPPRPNLALKNTFTTEYRSSPAAPRFPAPLSPTAIKKGNTTFGTIRSGAVSPTRRAGFGADGVEVPMVIPSATGTAGIRAAAVIRPTFTGGGLSSGRIECPRCNKVVYHAEQVTGPGGRKYHKLCLRCVQCSTALDSGKLTEKDGEPMCRNCYSKTHGPQGSGYALMGRAG